MAHQPMTSVGGRRSFRRISTAAQPNRRTTLPSTPPAPNPATRQMQRPAKSPRRRAIGRLPIPNSRAVAARDAVSELHDAEGATDAHRHGVAGQDGDHQNETGGVERTETAIAEEMVEQDHTDASDSNEISPGKNSLRKGMYSVASYAELIGESWRRSVEAIMEVARLCVEASERLSPQERRELVDKLPFSGTVLSKLIKIGKNERLQAPEVQRLLPPNYTIIYSLAGLHKYDLNRAIAERVVGPDMRRIDLEKWITVNRAPNSSMDPICASANSIPPQEPFAATGDRARDQRQAEAASGERRVSGKDLTTVGTVQAEPSNQPVPADAANNSLKLGGDADQVNNTAELRSRLTTNADSSLDSKVRSDVADDVAVEEIEIVSPPTAPVAEEEGSSDNVGLSPENQRIFDELMAMWDALVAKYRVSSSQTYLKFQPRLMC